jgi:hypothetical protein
MGLDLLVESCAKPGHEVEWRQILERYFGENGLPGDAVERFAAISIPPHEQVGAPRVGYDAAADAWIINARNAATPDEVADVLKAFHGYYVLRLAECDGVPPYSHGGLYDGVDETSFRGKFLEECKAVLSGDVIEKAWSHKFPEEAIQYGQALLAAADRAEAGGPPSEAEPTPPPKRGFFARLRKEEPAPAALPFDEQLRIVRAAGRWFLFWGERGHAIRAWY